MRQSFPHNVYPTGAVLSPSRTSKAGSRWRDRSGSENFHVLTPFLPRRLRADFLNVYAFCRTADDAADESASASEALGRLDELARGLKACFAGAPHGDPLFARLSDTIRRYGLAPDPFEDLLDAFRQDQHVRRYATWAELLDYCSRSASPVGRIVLRMVGHDADREGLAMSDATCTALQLVNFWQDVRRDVLERDRVYIPEDVAMAHGTGSEEISHHVRAAQLGDTAAFDRRYAACVRDLCDRTDALFARGEPLSRRVPRDAAPVIRLFTLGGRAVLAKIRAAGYQTYRRRPALNPVGKALLLVRALVSTRPPVSAEGHP